ncbi:hypothetical protein EDB92DRAFT_1880438 [Lactarius akahatsu]|uniref:Uncharacterized protein n=1 Tax=Lactarius akahatsu TaxID=416441 RepID=A0AAD4LBU3_9AGAM|nr:hypothetical protein EDB92DRAFT_1880438 [Lactarius akahatsu]
MTDSGWWLGWWCQVMVASIGLGLLMGSLHTETRSQSIVLVHFRSLTLGLTTSRGWLEAWPSWPCPPATPL